MRPAALCTAPPEVHGESVITDGGGAVPPPTSTVKPVVAEVVVLPPLLAPSRAMTRQLHDPSHMPVRLTVHSSAAVRPAA